LVEDIINERALARSGDTGDAGENAQREPDVYVIEVMFMGVLDLQKAVRLAS